MYAKTLFIIALAITLSGCDALVDTVLTPPDDNVDPGSFDDNPLVGVWSLETIDDQTPQMAIPGFENLSDFFHVWTFYANGQFERRWGWTVGPNADGVVVSPPVYFSIEGLYTVDGDRLTMQITKSTFFGDIPGEDAGTWARDGDTLTLTFDGGTVIVLKEKV
ncbi:hypothetical protein C6502_01340 [Candidatus Poribacteria bacterium]|nr:MAG: hypothetical protein C6502_01340 [Candidatus Poribacteria bacterium]